MGLWDQLKQVVHKGKVESVKVMQRTELYLRLRNTETEKREHLFRLGERLFPHLQRAPEDEKFRVLTEDILKKIEELSEEIALIKAQMEDLSQGKKE